MIKDICVVASEESAPETNPQYFWRWFFFQPGAEEVLDELEEDEILMSAYERGLIGFDKIAHLYDIS